MTSREPLIWRLLARALSHPWMVRRILRASWSPYTDIGPQDDLYMARWWVFNGYRPGEQPRFPRLPSIRLNCIIRPDASPHHHDHPWRCRAIILRGSYLEARYGKPDLTWRDAGTTYAMRPGLDFHSIVGVVGTPTWSLFITWPRREGDPEWGFLVDGVKVGHREYLTGTGNRPHTGSNKPCK